MVGSGEGLRTLTEDRYFSSLVYQAEVTPDAAGNAGLLFRSGANMAGRFAYRGYYAFISASSGEVALSRTRDSAAVTLGSKPMAIKAAMPYLLRVVARGPQIKVYVQDTVQAAFTVIDSAFDGGLIGLRSHNGTATFDNLYARGLAADSGNVGFRRPGKRIPGATPRGLRVHGTMLFPSEVNAAGRRMAP